MCLSLTHRPYFFLPVFFFDILQMSQGGLGTIQHSMAMKDLYGDDIDLLLWDCGKSCLWRGNKHSI